MPIALYPSLLCADFLLEPWRIISFRQLQIESACKRLGCKATILKLKMYDRGIICTSYMGMAWESDKYKGIHVPPRGVWGCPLTRN